MNDKMKHFIVSFLLVLVFNLLPWFTLAMAVGFTFFIGMLKELIWDLLLSKGCSEWLDVLANCCGILTAVALITLIS